MGDRLNIKTPTGIYTQDSKMKILKFHQQFNKGEILEIFIKSKFFIFFLKLSVLYFIFSSSHQ